MENGQVVVVTEIPTRRQRTNPCSSSNYESSRGIIHTVIINRLVRMNLKVIEEHIPDEDKNEIDLQQPNSVDLFWNR